MTVTSLVVCFHFCHQLIKIRKSKVCTIGARKKEGIMDNDSKNLDNPKIPSGFTFFGQFIDHDITFDPTSSLEHQNDPNTIENFRTPVLELDSIYGGGPVASPHLYDITTGGIKLLIDKDFPNDVPRNSQNTALMADPRNDENLIISQLHLAFLKFHNAVVDQVIANGITAPFQAFAEAQRLVRWHYQWIVLYEYLPLIVGKSVIKDILKNGRKFYKFKNKPYIPVEFAMAAFRIGHSQVRPVYKVNSQFTAPIFNSSQDQNHPDPDDLRGGKRAPRRFVEWSNFFNTESGVVQQGKKSIRQYPAQCLNYRSCQIQKPFRNAVFCEDFHSVCHRAKILQKKCLSDHYYQLICPMLQI